VIRLAFGVTRGGQRCAIRACPAQDVLVTPVHGLCGLPVEGHGRGARRAQRLAGVVPAEADALTEDRAHRMLHGCGKGREDGRLRQVQLEPQERVGFVAVVLHQEGIGGEPLARFLLERAERHHAGGDQPDAAVTAQHRPQARLGDLPRRAELREALPGIARLIRGQGFGRHRACQQVQGEVVAVQAHHLRRHHDQPIAGLQRGSQVHAHGREVVLAILWRIIVVIGAVNAAGQQQGRQRYRGPMPDMPHGRETAGHQQQECAADQAEVPRVHVGRLHPLDDLKQQDGQQQECGQEPGFRIGQPATAQRPRNPDDCQGRKDQVEPQNPADIHAEPQAEGVQQVARHDRQRDDGKVRPGARALQHEAVQRPGNECAGRQQTHDDQAGLPAAPCGQSHEHDDGMDRQDEHGQIVRAQQQQERNQIAEEVSPRRGPGVLGPPAQQKVGAHQREQRHERIHTHFAPVP